MNGSFLDIPLLYRCAWISKPWEITAPPGLEIPWQPRTSLKSTGSRHLYCPLALFDPLLRLFPVVEPHYNTAIGLQVRLDEPTRGDNCPKSNSNFATTRRAVLPITASTLLRWRAPGERQRRHSSRLTGRSGAISWLNSRRQGRAYLPDAVSDHFPIGPSNQTPWNCP